MNVNRAPKFREIYTNSHKNFTFFHLNPPNKFLSTLAIKDPLRPKYPSISSLLQHSLSPISPKPKKLPSSAVTSALVGGGSIPHQLMRKNYQEWAPSVDSPAPTDRKTTIRDGKFLSMASSSPRRKGRAEATRVSK